MGRVRKQGCATLSRPDFCFCSRKCLSMGLPPSLRPVPGLVYLGLLEQQRVWRGVGRDTKGGAGSRSLIVGPCGAFVLVRARKKCVTYLSYPLNSQRLVASPGPFLSKSNCSSPIGVITRLARHVRARSAGLLRSKGDRNRALRPETTG